jgi:hypothetical protein
MGEMKKVNLFTVKSGSSFLRGVKDGHGDDIDESKIQYCQSCLQSGIKSVLKRRMYSVEVQDQDQDSRPRLVPASVPDADRFRQCYRCGDIVPIYNVKYESKIEDFIDPIDNPFDNVPSKMDGFTPGISKSNGLNKSKSLYKRKKKYIESITDLDIKEEILKGNRVTIYGQSQLTGFTES